ncbi:hypothetical protein L0Y65_06505 [Candidatus Micrarchaeota archaeon]|nr:hypothetical protein [Candidatus Micrarchaeota archaeon]
MLQFLLAFIAGALVKTVDWLDDTKKSRNPIKYVLAILYGVAIGYLISVPQLSAIFIAALAAQVFARKVDTAAHRLGFLVAALSLLVFSFPTIDPLLFFFFLIMAVLDEMDYIGRFRPLVEYRPFLKIGALLPVVWGVWDYVFGILVFDIGYELVAALTKSREAEKAAVSREEKTPVKERPYRSKTRNQ